MDVPTRLPEYFYGEDGSVGHIFMLKDMGEIFEDLNNPTPLLMDKTILFFLHALVTAAAARKRMSDYDVRIVDPIILSLLTGVGSVHDPESTPGKAVAHYRKIFNAGRIKGRTSLVMPIHAHTHWTLLYFHGPSGRWFHYDSMEGGRGPSSHHSIVLKLLKLFAEHGVIDESEHQSARFDLTTWDATRRDKWSTPQQNGGWECGFFTLMFLHCLAHKNFEPLTNDMAPYCNQASLPAFRAKIMRPVATVMLKTVEKSALAAAAAAATANPRDAKKK